MYRLFYNLGNFQLFWYMGFNNLLARLSSNLFFWSSYISDNPVRAAILPKWAYLAQRLPFSSVQAVS